MEEHIKQRTDSVQQHLFIPGEIKGIIKTLGKQLQLKTLQAIVFLWLCLITPIYKQLFN